VVGEPLDVNQVSSERDFQALLKDKLTAVREEACSLYREPGSSKRLSRFLI